MNKSTSSRFVIFRYVFYSSWFFLFLSISCCCTLFFLMNVKLYSKQSRVKTVETHCRRQCHFHCFTLDQSCHVTSSGNTCFYSFHFFSIFLQEIPTIGNKSIYHFPICKVQEQTKLFKVKCGALTGLNVKRCGHVVHGQANEEEG